MVSKIFRMKRGTKVGWLMVAFAILLSLWVIISQSAKADTTTPEGLVLDDTKAIVTGYTGAGGAIQASFFPATVTTIGDRAFAGNANITSVELPTGVTTIGQEAFSGCAELTNIAISTTGITNIPSNAFANCNKLSSVSLPAGIDRIDANAFLNCGSLQSCSLPADATVDPNAFKGCSSLIKYEISGTGTNYMSYGGNLYDTTGARLLRVAPGLSTLDANSIYSGCTEIGAGAFSANQWLTEFTVPSQIITIAQDAFKGSKIVKLTVSAASTNIAEQSDWTTLKEVYGPSDSPAEMFAVMHEQDGVMFYPIGNTASPDDVTDSESPDATPTPTPTPGTNAQGGNINGDANSGTIVNNNITGGNSTSSTVTNGGGSAYTVNGKDATPKTADGDLDIRWFAILGLFMAGLSIVFFSRFKKTEYIVSKESDDNDLDF